MSKLQGRAEVYVDQDGDLWLVDQDKNTLTVEKDEFHGPHADNFTGTQSYDKIKINNEILKQLHTVLKELRG
jgi:hypothetical protein